MIIKTLNVLDKTAPYSFTTSDINATGTIPVKNISQFYPSWAIQIGKTGEEKSEIRVLGASTPSGTTITTTANTNYDHPADTPIYSIKFNQVIFKRSTAGTAGTATALTDGTVTITPDNPYTIFDDTTGATTYAYKAQYRNSVTGDLSSESDWLTPSGYTFYSKYSLRERAKNKLFSANYVKVDNTVDDWINEWLEAMNNKAVDVNQDYNIGTVDVAFGTNGLGTITSTDFKDIRKVDTTTDGINFYRAARITTIDFQPQEVFETTNPFYYMQGDNVFGIKNGNAAGTVRLIYYKLNTVLTNDTDELPTSMKGYTKTFVDYTLSQAYYMDNKPVLGDRFLASANEGKESFIKEISPRAKSGPTYIHLTEAISGEDFDGYL